MVNFLILFCMCDLYKAESRYKLQKDLNIEKGTINLNQADVYYDHIFLCNQSDEL